MRLMRAWNRHEQKMYPIRIMDDWSLLADNDLLWGKREDWIFMDSTGLKDCRGNEMYEGDIVRWKIWSPNSEHEDETTERYVIDSVVLMRGCFCAAKRVQILGTIEPYRRLEVIGNIYETPQLMEGKP